MSPAPSGLGVVVIGRNEGERLGRCLDSLEGEARLVVYVDSASSDGSAACVRSRGIEVIELDASRPLNAARGRNAGWRSLVERHPSLDAVFFVDGDCALVPGFLSAARAELEREASLAAVCGRRRELFPAHSFFNRVVDSEWNTPLGESETFGGDVLVRARALIESGGYREELNQGEDPEFAFRLRRAGWRIRRLDQDMTGHDVALGSYSAWRRRHQRGGYAYAHGAALHWGEPGRYNQRAVASILAWGAVLPAGVALSALPSDGWSLLALAAYALPWSRIRSQRLQRGDAPGHAARYAALITLGKIEEVLGVLRCAWALLRRREALTLEYKERAARRAA